MNLCSIMLLLFFLNNIHFFICFCASSRYKHTLFVFVNIYIDQEYFVRCVFSHLLLLSFFSLLSPLYFFACIIFLSKSSIYGLMRVVFSLLIIVVVVVQVDSFVFLPLCQTNNQY